MLGRKQTRINELQEEVEALRGDLITFENLKTKTTRLEERLTTMQRNITRADQDREEALDKAYDAGKQIDYLARWFQDNAPDKIREGGAINNAIVLLNEALRLEEDLTTYADSLDKRTAELSDAENRIGLQDAEIKQLKLDKAALEKTAGPKVSGETTTSSTKTRLGHTKNGS
jgi:DNA repair exonuclease SbcCD ATPase subunit